MHTENDAIAVARQFESYVADKFPFMANIMQNGRTLFGQQWEIEFGDLLCRMFQTDDTLYSAARGYVEFAIDSMRLQKKFEKERVYKEKSYKQAMSEVYNNPEYMSTLYLPGILLSHFLWPHHYRQKLFCEATFLKDMTRAKPDTFYDVGIGTGFYSRLALQASENVKGRGYDISETSKSYAEHQVSAFGLAPRYEVELCDIVQDTPADTVEFAMSVEILEHLQDPESFLAALRKILAPGGKAFVTAALNAANADHIYLYRTPLEVADQLRQAGFQIEQYHSGMAYPPPAVGVPVPEIVAFIVT
jgi:2-polyprenyl-3-methyl-5-hydroxy-6-metoxy-1,4-benzoquinol methylase